MYIRQKLMKESKYFRMFVAYSKEINYEKSHSQHSRLTTKLTLIVHSIFWCVVECTCFSRHDRGLSGGVSILYFKYLYNSPEAGLKYISDMRSLLDKGIKNNFEETFIWITKGASVEFTLVAPNLYSSFIFNTNKLIYHRLVQIKNC